MSAATPFIGRKTELATLLGALEAAAGGEGRLVLLAGEAGIGKTRLATALAARAPHAGARVLWGRCLEEPGAPPYWPWIQAIRACAETLDDAALRAALGAGAGHLAQIVPEILERLGEPPAAVRTADSDHARFQLFDAVARFWRNAARTQPLVVILDNLHWADATSLRLLTFLASELEHTRLLILGTYRDTDLTRRHPLSETLADLNRLPPFRRLVLTGLSRDETEQFLAASGGALPDAALTAAVYGRTEGHPLFLVETVRFLAEERRSDESPSSSAPAAPIPMAIREIIGKRLNRLSPLCCRLLGLAASMGRAFDGDLLARLSPEAADEPLLAALEEAQVAHLIEPLAPAGQYQFTHALIRETLYEELLPVRRVRLHQRIAEWIEERHRDHLEPYLTQLAYHFGESAAAGGARKALEYTHRAAARAAEIRAYEEAVRLYQAALAIHDEHFAAEWQQRCELLLALGAAQNGAGASETAQHTFLAAAALARETGSAARLAQAALGFESAGWRVGRFGEQAATLLEEALSGDEAGDEPLKASLLAALCRAQVFCGRVAQAQAAHREAVALARKVGDPRGLVEALAALVPARFWPESLEERLAAASEALALAEQAGHPEWAVGNLTGWHYADLLEKGDLEGARAVVATHLRVAEQMRQPFLLASGLQGATTLAIHEGRFAEAERLARRTLAAGRRFSPETAAGTYGMQMFVLRREQGRLAEVLPLLRHFAATTPTSATWRPGLAVLYAELDMRAEAAAEYRFLARDDFAALARDESRLTGSVYLAEVCVYLGEARHATAFRQRLAPFAGRNLVTGAACFGSADLLLGRLAHLQGQWDEAEHHLQAAIALAEQCGGRPWLAHGRYQYASLLAERDRAGDHEHIGALLAAALAASQELGMAALEKRCRALLEQSEDRLVFPAGLSKREVDVLRLIAAGRSNAEIGERLFISPHTVANHIRNILGKTQTANRTEAAGWAMRHGLA